jgi:hypothetical protein
MSTIKATTLSTQSNATVPIDTVVNGTAKAWVNFNGTGTVAIRRAFNVSSITDAAVGYYTVNFTTAMPDANYSVLTGGAGAVDNTGVMQVNSSSVIPTSVQIQSGVTGGYNSQDNPYVFCAIFS